MAQTGQTDFPQIGTPFVDEERMLEVPWYRFLLALWRIVGGSSIPILQAVYFKLTSPLNVEVFGTSQNNLIGTLRLKNEPGATEVPQTLTTSPFVFSSPGDGTLVVFSAKSELKRSAGYYEVSLTGGAIPLMKDDAVRVSWTGPTPTVTWFPSG